MRCFPAFKLHKPAIFSLEMAVKMFLVSTVQLLLFVSLHLTIMLLLCSDGCSFWGPAKRGNGKNHK